MSATHNSSTKMIITTPANAKTATMMSVLTASKVNLCKIIQISLKMLQPVIFQRSVPVTNAKKIFYLWKIFLLMVIVTTFKPKDLGRNLLNQWLKKVKVNRTHKKGSK